MTDFRVLRRRIYSAAKFANRGANNPRYDTSDIAQESILQLLNQLENQTLEEGGINESYLQKVCRGNANRLLKKSLAKRRSINAQSNHLEVTDLQDQTNDPSQQVQQRDSVVHLVRTISHLSPEYQFVVYRRFFDHKKIVEIARELEVTVDVVRGRLDRALKKMEGLLKSEMDSTEPGGLPNLG